MKITTKKYVNDLLIFKGDISLPEMQQSLTGLAASGARQKHQLLNKLGSIRDSENRVIVKVYENSKLDAYLVFFVFSEYDPKFAIISHPDVFKYYLMKPDNSILIPKSDGIDPLHDRLNISFPIDVFHTRMKSLTENTESLISGEKGSELSYAYHPDTRSLDVTVLPPIDGIISDGTKILVTARAIEELQNNMALFPIRNKKARIILPRNTKDLLTLCIYR